jgi:uncharacterized protein
MQKAVITGGTSGIGYELAKVMAAAKHDLILVARDQKQLQKTAENLTTDFGIHVHTVTADLSQPGEAKKIYEQLRDKGAEILVNNAGVGLKGSFLETSIDRNLAMMQLNMNSLVELCHYFGNDFASKGTGKILNIASIAAFLPGPKQPVYYATKAFVRNFSRALAYSLKNTGVSVTTLHPGVTKTNFFTASDAAAMTKGASPQDVARLGYKAMMAGKAEVTHGLLNKFLTNVIVRITPYSAQATLVDKSSDV